VLLGAALAWAVLLWPSSPGSEAGAAGSAPTTHLHHHGVPGAAGHSVVPDLATTSAWALMVVAMMWPLAVPATDAVVRAAYRRWRPALAATCLATFTVLWLAVGAAGAAVAGALAVDPQTDGWVLTWLAVAVAGTWSSHRHRLLSRCGRFPVIAPGGRRGLSAAVRAGAVVWRRCALLCGPVMLAMVGGHGTALMVCASLAVWWEAWHPRAWRDPVPALLLVCGAVATLLGPALAEGLPGVLRG